MELEIITPDHRLFNGKARSVQVPGSKGSFTILRNHAPIISSLEKGILRVLTQDYEDLTFEIENGFVEVKKNKIIILVETRS